MILAASAPADTGPRIGTDKKIIKTGQDRPTPAYLRDHVAEMERLPFDGLAIALERPGDEERHLRRLEYQWWQPRPIEQQVHEDTVAVLAPVPFSRFTDNFLWISTQSRFEPAPSWTDEEAFAAIRRNMVLAARIAKDAGLKGIFVDVEQYGGMRWSRWMMRFNYPYAHSQEPGMVARGLIDRVVPFEEYVDATQVVESGPPAAFSFTVFSEGPHNVTALALQDREAGLCAASQCNDAGGSWASDTVEVACEHRDCVCETVLQGVCAEAFLECCCIDSCPLTLTDAAGGSGLSPGILPPGFMT